MNLTGQDLVAALIAAGGLAFLLSTSGRVVGRALSSVRHRTPPNLPPEDADAAEERTGTGRLIGKCENILVYVFVLLGEHTALAILFTAKALVRQEDIRKDSLYFLAGMMVNVTYSFVVAVLVQLLLARL